jgi:hypothetical protein
VWPSVWLLLACSYLVSLSMLVLESIRERDREERDEMGSRVANFISRSQSSVALSMLCAFGFSLASRKQVK